MAFCKWCIGEAVRAPIRNKQGNYGPAIGFQTNEISCAIHFRKCRRAICSGDLNDRWRGALYNALAEVILGGMQLQWRDRRLCWSALRLL